jgi:hypothetical protein
MSHEWQIKVMWQKVKREVTRIQEMSDEWQNNVIWQQKGEEMDWVWAWAHLADNSSVNFVAHEMAYTAFELWSKVPCMHPHDPSLASPQHTFLESVALIKLKTQWSFLH